MNGVEMGKWVDLQKKNLESLPLSSDYKWGMVQAYNQILGYIDAKEREEDLGQNTQFGGEHE